MNKTCQSQTPLLEASFILSSEVFGRFAWFVAQLFWWPQMCRYHYQNYGCDIKQAGLNLFFCFFFFFFFVLLFFQPLYRRATSYFYLTSYFPGLRGNLFFYCKRRITHRRFYESHRKRTEAFNLSAHSSLFISNKLSKLSKHTRAHYRSRLGNEQASGKPRRIAAEKLNWFFPRQSQTN